MGLREILRGLKSGEEGKYDKAYKRLNTLKTSAVLAWAQQAGNGVYMALEAYEKEQDHAALVEARTGVLALLAATQVLEDRA